ncbi:PQQ-binding-like beta-propeller repeat protein [Poriferisphaera sp. WC338]|uniref:outer membrane protein assembly factor BamB family protein n=1 Tax=Poriferisphaera sp. WC338 TaxID=3425129 RepID=UPI003D81568F
MIGRCGVGSRWVGTGRNSHVWGVVMLLAGVLIGWVWGGAASLQAAELPGAGQMRPVYIEDSPVVAENMDRAMRLIAEDQLTAAVRVLQGLMDDHPNKLLPKGQVTVVAEEMLVETEEEDVAGALHHDAVLHVKDFIRSNARLYTVYREVFEPVAERELRDTAIKNDDQVGQLIQRYWLTEAAVAANLDLVARKLEQARIADARSMLRLLANHPLIDEQGERYLELSAIGAYMANDQHQGDQYVTKLKETGAKDAAERVILFASQIDPSLHEQEAIKLHLKESLPKQKESTLWEVTFHDPNQAYSRQVRPNNTRQVSRIALQNTLAVLGRVRGDAIYINHGEYLLALDRFSGREIWRYVPEEAEENKRSVRARSGRMLLDPRQVATNGTHLFGVIGRVSAWAGHRMREFTETKLVSVEMQTGKSAWEVRLAGLKNEGLDRAFFQGTPILSENRLYAIAERRPATGFQDTYLLAFDARSGDLLWKRHLASTANMNRNAIDSIANMQLHDGVIYLTDYLGAVAAIDARLGTVNWVRLFERSKPKRQEFAVHASNMLQMRPPPFMTEQGLVVVTDQRLGVPVLLDPQTGSILRSLTEAHWQNLAQMKSYPSGLILITDKQMHHLDPQTLEKKWSIPISESGVSVLAGQVGVAEGVALISTNNRLLIIDLATGTVTRQMMPLDTGNILLADRQVLMLNAADARCFMPWETALSHLRGQVAMLPQEVKPGLALAHIAMRYGSDEVMLEGMDDAVRALEQLLINREHDRHQKSQKEVFDQIFAMLRLGSGLSDEMKLEMFNRLAAIVSGREQEIQYHFAAGEFYQRVGKVHDAVEHYQSILLDPQLTDEMLTFAQTTRPSGAEAKMRISQMIQLYGRDIYGRYDHMAESNFKELQSDPTMVAEDYVSLAEKYPHASVTPAIMFHAGQLVARDGHPKTAKRYYRDAYHMMGALNDTEHPLLGQLVSQLTLLHIQDRKPDQAIQWLQRVKRDYPTIVMLSRGDAFVEINTWIDELANTPGSSDQYAQVRFPITSLTRYKGELLTCRTQVQPGQDHFLTATPFKLYCFKLGETKPIWSVKMQQSSPQLIHMSDTHAYLAFTRNGHMKLKSVLLADGSDAWPIVDLKPVLKRMSLMAHENDAEEILAEIFVQENDNADELTGSTHYKVLYDAQMLIVSDGKGRLVAVDAARGKLKWRNRIHLEAIDEIQIKEDVLAILGRKHVALETETSGIMLLSVSTGESIRHPIELAEKPTQVSLTDDGRLIAVSRRQLTAYQLFDSSILWRIVLTDEELSNHAWFGADHTLVIDRDGLLHVIDARHGMILKRLTLQTIGVPRMAKARQIGGHWFVMTTSNAVAIAEKGEVAWRDAIVMPGRKLFATQAFTNSHAVYLSAVVGEDDFWHQEEMVGPADQLHASFRYNVYALNRENGLLQHVYQLPGLEQPLLTEQMQLMNQAILLTDGQETFVLQGEK